MAPRPSRRSNCRERAWPVCQPGLIRKNHMRPAWRGDPERASDLRPLFFGEGGESSREMVFALMEVDDKVSGGQRPKMERRVDERCGVGANRHQQDRRDDEAANSPHSPERGPHL